jgi:hypothetical protein
VAPQPSGPQGFELLPELAPHESEAIFDKLSMQADQDPAAQEVTRAEFEGAPSPRTHAPVGLPSSHA